LRPSMKSHLMRLRASSGRNAMNAGSGQLPRLDGIDAHMKVVDTGTDMVNAMHNGDAQIGDMSAMFVGAEKGIFKNHAGRRLTNTSRWCCAGPACMKYEDLTIENIWSINTLKGAPRLDVPDQFRPSFMAEVEKVYPEYFADLPPLN